MKQWYNDIQAILRGEPETWIAYLYGQQLNNLPHLTRTKPRLRGGVLRFAGFLLFLLRHLKLRQPTSVTRPAQYLVFASTINQMRALEGTVNFLTKNGCRVVQIGHAKHLGSNAQREQCVSFSFTVPDVMKVLVLLVVNTKSLHRQLKTAHPLATSWYLDVFCGVYAYLVYFHRVLKDTQPELVLVANDHNPANRSLLAIAHHLGIKTAYIQHASVSPLFPALRVNYAFLDGQCAQDIYSACEPNQPATDRQLPVPEVYLTGQQKRLRQSQDKSGRVGGALNALDCVETAASMVRTLLEAQRAVTLRWHPGQSGRNIEVMRRAFAGLEQVQWSDPRRQDVGDFLADISYLIAGNSSIHLEAALAGVNPIYYEFSLSDKSDYYGYVKRGLVKAAESLDEVLAYTGDIQSEEQPDAETVRYYSMTLNGMGGQLG